MAVNLKEKVLVEFDRIITKEDQEKMKKDGFIGGEIKCFNEAGCEYMGHYIVSESITCPLYGNVCNNFTINHEIEPCVVLYNKIKK